MDYFDITNNILESEPFLLRNHVQYCGGKITVYGPRNEESIEEATKVVLRKMGSMHVKTIEFDELKDIEYFHTSNG